MPALLRSMESAALHERTRRVYAQHDADQRALTDRLFAVLAGLMWTATLALYCITIRAQLLSPSTVATAVGGLLAAGAAFVGVPVYCTLRYSGHKINPYLAAISLSSCSILFVRVSGRTDSELAFFVVLAFLAFYRSISVLGLATVLLVADLVAQSAARGMLSARSEDIAWILIFDLVLYASMSRVSAGMRRGSAQQANLEQISAQSEMAKTIVFESAPDGVIRYDRDFRIIEINPVAEDMLQTTRQMAAGRLVSDFIPTFQPADHHQIDGHVALVGRFFEGSVVRPNKTEFIAECYSSEISGLDDTQYAMFIRDISARKALETQLAQARKLESIGQLAAGIAHEINTPTQYVGDNTLFLSDVFTDLSVLLDAYASFEDSVKDSEEFEGAVRELEEAREQADLDYMKAEIPRAIRESLDGIDRISVIVRALKDFSHPGSEGMMAGDVNRIVESTATVARNEWKYVAELELELCPNMPPILCLPGELGQVVLNLIVNASHAIGDKTGNSGEKGLIKISTAFDGEKVSVRVTDNGTGIPNAVKERVFDPFFTTKQVGQGTGQGLAIAYNVVVERHKGQLWFESEEGKGTTFTFSLPIDPTETIERHESCLTAA